MILNGRIGQVSGPFEANVDLLNTGQPIGDATPESTKPVIYKIGIQSSPGTLVTINNSTIKIGATGIYQLDQIVNITKLSFPNGADENTLIDFVY